MSTKQQQIAELARNDLSTVFTSLNAALDMELLRRAYRLTNKSGAVGVDGQSSEDYAENLEANLTDLLTRLKSGSYQALPVRRVLIPKAGSRTETRPLGIPTFEDKIAQRAVLLLLEPVYEPLFDQCSFGFRPGRSAHQALRYLRDELMEKGQRWVLDVDVRKYFDTIDHQKLRAFLDQRVKDGVIRRLIDKWLKAGVMDSGQRSRSSSGTPQGGVISPLLANIYLHYVLDEWFATVVTPRMNQRVTLTRFADDFVIGCEDYADSQRILKVLPKRFSRFGLELHPEKTKLIDFRFKRPNGMVSHASGTSFDFLGFTHVWGKSRRGKPVIFQRTAKDRYKRSLKAISDYCRHARHKSLCNQHEVLCRRIQGHYAYFGITGNAYRIRCFLHEVQRIWQKWLTRRTRSLSKPWKRFERIYTLYPLPKARIVHQYQAARSEAAS